MSGPPPPPPPGPPPPPPAVTMQKIAASSKDKDRGALLGSIQKGAKLKKTTTVDKSAPVIEAPKGGGGGVGGGGGSSGGGGGHSGSSGGMAPAPGGMLAGLGAVTLKKAGSKQAVAASPSPVRPPMSGMPANALASGGSAPSPGMKRPPPVKEQPASPMVKRAVPAPVVAPAPVSPASPVVKRAVPPPVAAREAAAPPPPPAREAAAPPPPVRHTAPSAGGGDNERWHFAETLPAAPAFTGGARRYQSGRSGGARLMGLQRSASSSGNLSSAVAPAPVGRPAPVSPVAPEPVRKVPPPPGPDKMTVRKVPPPPGPTGGHAPDAHRPPPAAPGGNGGGPKGAGAKGPKRPPKTDEEWLGEAMRKVGAEAAKASAAGEANKARDYNESLQLLKRLHERLTSGDGAQQQQVRAEIAQLRGSFAGRPAQ